MKKLYCFDFDGTLTQSDTMFLYLKFYNPSLYYLNFARHIPLFILLKMKLADAEKVKRNFIASIIKGEKKEKLDKKSMEFFEKYYPKLIRKSALDFIKNMDRDKTESLMVTASLDIWTEPFARKFGMTLLATQAEYKDGVFTGKFIGKNCNNEEKVKRIETAINGRKFDKTIAFGDTSSDKPMLRWATESHYKFFH